MEKLLGGTREYLLQMTKNIFHIRALRYGEILEIDQLDLRQGETTVLVGQSGSGKTTLLKLLNHLISPSSGTILYKDKSVNEWDPIALRREVVMLGQNPLVWEGRVRENLQMGLRWAEKEMPSDQTLEEVLDLVHLDQALTADPQVFSGGEKQRLAIARAILLHPQVLLLDEPSSALDPATAQSVMTDVLAALRKEGVTVIMVTHDLTLAKERGDRVLTMAYGTILEEEA